MRRPSRLLPKVQTKPMPLGAWVLLGLLAAALGFALWRQPFVALALVLLLFGVSACNWFLVRRHLQRLAAGRKSEDIGAFAKQFDVRKVDTWVIRAVYAELQEYLSSEVNAFPLRASDRLAEDLKVDQGDLEDIVACRVAERAGRSPKAEPTNPFYGNVRTVGDLVLFFNAQSRAAET
jgi:hypothetical protein